MKYIKRSLEDDFKVVVGIRMVFIFMATFYPLNYLATMNILKTSSLESQWGYHTVPFQLCDSSTLCFGDSEHKYLHDWRTKKPTIFRATEQWFASVEGFHQAAMDAIGHVKWIPAQLYSLCEKTIVSISAGKYWAATATAIGDVYMWDGKKSMDKPPVATRLHRVKGKKIP
ncbi:isoleucine--tRNA ligase isoform X2 [Gossypium hirsutum]|uniref:Isoleucine--tRNA ligase isoform X2 n=1 Tax=Gossypium hirsutum TaxID=3635 RepID=A0ABM3BDP8_GOSHI|nr:isoleucine--tRNA ligase-like isoform X2 [Gossypium hirsutum]XP_040965180.1 isoleucine--tRNA ligase-like isoform X2 [Gossypium hirsutum]